MLLYQAQSFVFPRRPADMIGSWRASGVGLTGSRRLHPLPHLFRRAMAAGLALAYSKNLGAAVWAYALGRGPAIFHGYRFGILYFPLGAALHTVGLHGVVLLSVRGAGQMPRPAGRQPDCCARPLRKILLSLRLIWSECGRGKCYISVNVSPGFPAIGFPFSNGHGAGPSRGLFRPSQAKCGKPFG